MTPQHPTLHPLYPLALYTDEAQAHLQQHVLHGEIGGHAAYGYVLWLAFLAILRWEQVERAGLVQSDVGRRDPLALAVFIVGRIVVYGFGSCVGVIRGCGGRGRL